MKARITRRDMLRLLIKAGATGAAAAGLGPLVPGVARAYGRKSYFTWVQLRYGGTWDPNPAASQNLLAELRRRTSVEPTVQRKVIGIGDEDVFWSPFLYVAGRRTFHEFSAEEAAWLRRYLEYGGFVFFDDATGVSDSGFFEGAAEVLQKTFPGRKLRPLPADHAVFRSFYLLDDAPGRKLVKPFLYGVDLEDLTPAIICANDLSGAWEGSSLTGYTHQCVPGGERQREFSFRMGINLILYALTGNYKKDQVHIPFILKRRKR